MEEIDLISQYKNLNEDVKNKKIELFEKIKEEGKDIASDHEGVKNCCFILSCPGEDEMINGYPKYIIDYPYKDLDSDEEKKILSDFNCQVIHTSPEYQKNLELNTPTNRIITSMCSKERLLFLLKYGISYVNSEKEIDGKLEKRDEKHIMRYQQFFASLKVREKIDEGAKHKWYLVVFYFYFYFYQPLSFYI